jgi:hypothetical protein
VQNKKPISKNPKVFKVLLTITNIESIKIAYIKIINKNVFWVNKTSIQRITGNGGLRV